MKVALAVAALTCVNLVPAHAESPPVVTEADEKAFLNFVLEEPTPGEPQYSRSGCLIPEMPKVSNPPGTKLSMAVGPNEAELLLKNIYWQMRNAKVVETGECSCETRYPAWDDALAVFTDTTQKVAIEEWHLETRKVRDRAGEYSAEFRKLCNASGIR